LKGSYKQVEIRRKRERYKMTDYRLGSKYIMIRCDYCNKKLAFIDGNRDAIHDIMCIGCSDLRRPQVAFQEEEQEGGK
jgi:hypothetical protein